MPKRPPDYKASRREQILAAALACFARSGYDRTTIDEIVVEAGVSKGALYLYFKSKEEVFLALQRAHDEELQRRVEEAFAAGGNVRERLERAADAFLSSLKAEYGEFARIGLEFWSEAARQRRLKEKCAESYAEWQRFIAGLIRKAVRAGELRPNLNPEALASVFLALYDGLTLHWIIHRQLVDAPEVNRAFLSSLFEGIAATSLTIRRRAPRGLRW